MAYNVAYGEGGQLATQLAGETGTAANWQACKRICADEESGEFLLPLEMVQKVMSCLAQFEADGVRGPSMVACDLANAALVSKDFHKASKFGFSTLEEQTAQLQVLPSSDFIIPASVRCSRKTLARLQRLPEAGGWSWQQWAACLQDPMQYSVYELKKAARQLAVPSNSSKLVSSILQAFGLQQPSSVSPQLLRAVLLERCCPEPWAGCEQLSLAGGLLQKVGRSGIDKLWPGLGEQLSASGLTSAAELRRALHTYTGACSARQLGQLLKLQEVLMQHHHSFKQGYKLTQEALADAVQALQQLLEERRRALQQMQRLQQLQQQQALEEQELTQLKEEMVQCQESTSECVVIVTSHIQQLAQWCKEWEAALVHTLMVPVQGYCTELREVLQWGGERVQQHLEKACQELQEQLLLPLEQLRTELQAAQAAVAAEVTAAAAVSAIE
ncbi:hypothetical protein OEZ86_008103 [Tetradesmus obliquus]|nr:hypothetical protein OEZ86_008103 [Tetradesmus obliquus]